MEVRSQVYCTNCGGTFVAALDMEIDGNHEITCPLCAHVHYRVVRDGEITEDRWRSSAGSIIPATIYAGSSVLSVSVTATAVGTTSSFLVGSWLSRSDWNGTSS